MDRSEIHRLLNACEQTPHLHVAVVMMLSTAGRVTAISEARWDHVDFDQRTLNLRTSENPHSKQRAFVPLNDRIYNLLLDWRSQCDTDWIVEYKGGPVKNIYKSFRQAAERAKLDDTHPHVLRHTAAVHMVASGCDMARVSQYLGHSSVSVTERIYARFAPQHLRREAESVDFLKDK
ncbi:tyrosine-type recombinase/integrase [Pacificitalea manganoxidans]|uniref:tyrosine-type recombinase/integrase n=1 Tax=Pacificitalea manganoxidans TaxID=1411902 RepID=UPI0035B53ED3